MVSSLLYDCEGVSFEQRLLPIGLPNLRSPAALVAPLHADVDSCAGVLALSRLPDVQNGAQPPLAACRGRLAGHSLSRLRLHPLDPALLAGSGRRPRRVCPLEVFEDLPAVLQHWALPKVWHEASGHMLTVECGSQTTCGIDTPNTRHLQTVAHRGMQIGLAMALRQPEDDLEQPRGFAVRRDPSRKGLQLRLVLGGSLLWLHRRGSHQLVSSNRK